MRIMDRSVDSIGSCSLDVDADSTDMSDTSGSLNLSSPLSGREFTKAFIARTQQDCYPIGYKPAAHNQRATTILNPTSGAIETVLSVIDSPPSSHRGNNINCSKRPSYLNLACCVNGYSNITTYNSKLRQDISRLRELSPIRAIIQNTEHTSDGGRYMNSQIITSSGPKIISTCQPIRIMENHNYRKNCEDTNNINRFSSTYLRETNGGGGKMNGTNGGHATGNATTESRMTIIKVKNESTSPSSVTFHNDGHYKSESPGKSFIQQRVERLYGPHALAQGFYSPKRVNHSESTLTSHTERSQVTTRIISSKLIRTDLKNSNIIVNPSDENSITDNSLPVLRHLRPEFRAQLQISQQSIKKPYQSNNSNELNAGNQYNIDQTSVKSNTSQCHTMGNTKTQLVTVNSDTVRLNTTTSAPNIKQNFSTVNGASKNSASGGEPVTMLMNRCKIASSDEVDKSLRPTNDNIEVIKTNLSDIEVCKKNGSTNVLNGSNGKIVTPSKSIGNLDNGNIGQENIQPNVNSPDVKNGNYFLAILNSERDRILVLADKLELEMESLVKNPDVSEEVLGYVRSAFGKARLLATQKMTQFEGLCHNNLTQSPDEKFPTTAEDLQGFWDMVMLQVDHIDLLFKEIDTMRSNNWKKSTQNVPSQPQGSKLTKRPVYNKPQTTQASGKKSASAQLAASKREAQRKQLMELKRKNKMALNQEVGNETNGGDVEQKMQQDDTIEIFCAAPSTSS